MRLGEAMGLMRGIIEQTVNNMAPEERREALLAVASQMVMLMTPDERRSVCLEAYRIVSDGLADVDRVAILRSLLGEAEAKLSER